jgi:gluconolactonase
MREWVDVRWERLDERFESIGGDRRLERIFAGGRWLEGPAYSPAWRCLLFSDIPNDRTLRWDGPRLVNVHAAGHASGARSTPGSCRHDEHGGRRSRGPVRRHDDSPADSWQKPSTVPRRRRRPDGTVWFTGRATGSRRLRGRPREATSVCYAWIDPDGAVEVVPTTSCGRTARLLRTSRSYIVDTVPATSGGYACRGGRSHRREMRGCRIDVRRRSSRRSGSSVGRGQDGILLRPDGTSRKLLLQSSTSPSAAPAHRSSPRPGSTCCLAMRRALPT